MKLEELGYTEKWMEYGLLTEEALAQQYADLQNGVDHNTEHYRYGTFMSWLNQKTEFTDAEIEEFIELAMNDSDQLMAGSAVKVLFTHPGITKYQFSSPGSKLGKSGFYQVKLRFSYSR
ncbi:MAG: hypothetical protein AAFQ98_19785, partial [Bacteroidota bacterium]